MGKSLKIRVLSIVLCLLLTCTIIFGFRGFSYFAKMIEDLRGYDYDSKIARQYDWIGPKPGEIIDTSHLLDSEGRSLKSFSTKRVILLTVVDPDCAASRATKDQFRFLDENSEANGVDRFIVCFIPKVSSLSLSDYVSSLNLSTKSLAWNSGLVNVLPSITSIAYPSHILIEPDGTVIKSFPGTSNEKVVRERMVRQVLKEVLVEKARRGEGLQ